MPSYRAKIGKVIVAEVLAPDIETAIEEVAQYLKIWGSNHYFQWRDAGAALFEVHYQTTSGCPWCGTRHGINWDTREIHCSKCHRTSYRVVLSWSKPGETKVVEKGKTNV